MVRVFTLNYVLASDVEKVVKGLMSPLGQSFSNKVTVDEQRNAHEQIVVEDVPSYLDRIAEYISQVDIMPRQVVVEANILQVLLKDNNKHGVNFNQLARINRANVTFGTMGLASGVPPATMMRVEGSDLTGLIDLLKSTSDTKTLASPKVSVVNGQKAKISVGGEIGYLLTTATNTSTLQSVAFLEFGVVLTVTPIITEDGQVLLTVAPQVSTGRINATTKLPEKESTEVQTTALLCDGQAIVIGGLIKESTIDGQNKIPFLGDLWFIGRLFQSRERLRERSEIILTLLPRIARPGESCLFASEEDYAQASTPLMDRNLNPVDRRSWEGELPDASKKTRSWNIFSRKKKTTDVPVTVVPAPIFREPEFNSSTYSTTGSTSVPQPPVVLPAANESTIPTSGPPMPY
jgi:type II secretory pathway component GspD/PulD (secretin)